MRRERGKGKIFLTKSVDQGGDDVKDHGRNSRHMEGGRWESRASDAQVHGQWRATVESHREVDAGSCTCPPLAAGILGPSLPPFPQVMQSFSHSSITR